MRRVVSVTRQLATGDAASNIYEPRILFRATVKPGVECSETEFCIKPVSNGFETVDWFFFCVTSI